MDLKEDRVGGGWRGVGMKYGGIGMDLKEDRVGGG